MKDINGKDIKPGMCIELILDNGLGYGVGTIHEIDGQLGFYDYSTFSRKRKFQPLSELDRDMVKGFLIVKE